ncbi:MAG TPA: DUF2336 domain-containing protein [Rhizomicrobium sp.]|nr:DUF2336 domain-containing protein [Rhizomicrobium sp.]
MSEPRERLTRLVELATQNAPERRRGLAIELCDLLLDWPANYPPAMREPFETLLEKTMRLIDRQTCAELIARIAASDAAAPAFLNEFFFDAPADLRCTILARNNDSTAQGDVRGIDEAALIDAARTSRRDRFTDTLAAALDMRVETAARILNDASAEALAVAVKGAHLSRAAFSALALLADAAGAPDEALTRLAAFDRVPQTAAENLLRFWRGSAATRSRAA